MKRPEAILASAATVTVEGGFVGAAPGVPGASSAEEARGASAARLRLADWVELTKVRLNSLVLVTAAVGFYLGSRGPLNLVLLAHAIVGTALVAAGAGVLNQLLERDTDARMRRTAWRPLAAGRVQPAQALAFGALASIAGVAYLTSVVNPVAGLLAAFTLASYVFVYTPLKRRTWLSTLVGAVPGALPPVIGWAAASGGVSVEAGVLFAIVAFWQMPHFFAIAWLYRDDYARAGFPLLPVIEPDGRSTARQIVLFTLVLIPVSLAPAALGLVGGVYLPGALLLGIGFLIFGVRFADARTAGDARRLFLASIAYLPLLWTLMVRSKL